MIGGMHFRLMIVPDQNNVEMIVIFYIPDSFIRENRRGRDGQAGETELLTLNGDWIGNIRTCGCGGKDRRSHFRGAQGNKAKLFIDDNKQPALIVNDLKHGEDLSGAIRLWVDVGTEVGVGVGDGVGVGVGVGVGEAVRV